MSKKEELIISLRESFSKNNYLKDLLKEIKKTETRSEGLKKIRREYPFIYDKVLDLIIRLPQGEDNLTKELNSLNL